jgi:peptide methionine sulfoxide reductase MsrA
MRALDASTIFEDPIVTELTALEAFYDAEEDHDNYYDLNREQPYCTYLIAPKIKKLRTHFKAILK